MCGIAGIYQNKNNINKRELKSAIERMNKSQKLRGPDDEGIFTSENNLVALGHRRLSILDLSKAGHQPMAWGDQHKSAKISVNQRLIITYNGEIYNFLELKKELEQKGYQFKTKTDTEVILALYSEYGEKSFSMLRGMFAFGLWDGHKQKLFLVKDRYGIKPLYYYSDNEKLVFASMVRALAKSGLVPIEKNPKALIGFLLFGSVPLPMTTIKNILAVPAGHYLIREAGGNQKLIQYYDPLEFYQHKSAEIPARRLGLRSHFGEGSSFSEGGSINQCVKKIRNLLEDSICHHLISDAPLGVFLSGGLDSSTIAALAAKSLNQHQSAEIPARRSLGEGGNINQRLKTLSIIFDEKEFSEEYYSDLVAKKINSDHRKIKVTKQDFYDSFDEVFKAMDQPTIDGVNTFFIAKAAKKAGLKTVLSGLGGDEIFLGYPHFRRAELLRKIQQLPRLLKMPLNLASLFGDRYSKLSYFINDDILSFYLGIRGLFSPKETAKILDTDLSEVNNFLNEFSISQFLNFSISQLPPVNLLSYLELKFYLQNQLLKDTDFMSMYHSIEVRVPFLDHPLVEYLSSLPPDIKLNQHKSAEIPARRSFSERGNINQRYNQLAINKSLLAESVRDLLPSEIIQRKKMGFTFPFQKWLCEVNDNLLISKKSHWSRFWATVVLSKFL